MTDSSQAVIKLLTSSKEWVNQQIPVLNIMTSSITTTGFYIEARIFIINLQTSVNLSLSLATLVLLA